MRYLLLPALLVVSCSEHQPAPPLSDAAPPPVVDAGAPDVVVDAAPRPLSEEDVKGRFIFHAWLGETTCTDAPNDLMGYATLSTDAGFTFTLEGFESCPASLKDNVVVVPRCAVTYAYGSGSLEAQWAFDSKKTVPQGNTVFYDQVCAASYVTSALKVNY